MKTHFKPLVLDVQPNWKAFLEGEQEEKRGQVNLGFNLFQGWAIS
jgi:hypothetical protein